MHQVKAQFAEGRHIGRFRLTRGGRLRQHAHLAFTRQLQRVIHIDRRDIHIATEQLRNKRCGAGEGHLDHRLQTGQGFKMQHEKMVVAADAGGGIGDMFWPSLGRRHQILQRL